MFRHFFILCFLFTSLAGLAAAEQTYEANGFKFQHRDSEKVTVTGDKIKTLRIENADNSLFMVQNYGSSITPEQLLEKMCQSLLNQFKDNATELTNKGASRTLLGKTRMGKYILFSKNDILSESLLFTFKKDGDTICVITQMALQHSKEAERMFATIQKSLSISKK